MLDRYETLVLFSGDSDFDYLIKKLKSKNRKIIVVSTKYHIAKELILGSDKYIDLKKLRRFVERENNKSPSFATDS